MRLAVLLKGAHKYPHSRSACTLWCCTSALLEDTKKVQLAHLINYFAAWASSGLFPGWERRGGEWGPNVFLAKLGYSGLMKLERILIKEFLDLSIFGRLLCMPFKLILILSINTSGESNGKLPPRTCPECSVPEPYRTHDWALIPASPVSKAEC